MVAGGCRDNSAFTFVVGQVADFVVRAAQFECTRVLHVFGLEKYLVAAQVRKKIARNEFRLLDDTRELFIGAVNVGNRRAFDNIGRVKSFGVVRVRDSFLVAQNFKPPVDCFK